MLRTICLWLAHLAGQLTRRRGFVTLLAVVVMASSLSMLSSAGGVLTLPWAHPSSSNEDSTAFELIMKDQAWSEGYTPMLSKVDPNHYHDGYWVIFRGTQDSNSHVDSEGNPLRVLCLHLYAQKIQYDDAGRLTPHPYFLGFLVWPEVLVKCGRGTGPGFQRTFKPLVATPDQPPPVHEFRPYGDTSDQSPPVPQPGKQAP